MDSNKVENKNAGANESGSGAFEAFGRGAVPLPATNLKTCADPTCNKQFIPDSKHSKYCSDRCASRMHKHKKEILNNLNKPCKMCGNDHDHRYGTGCFCFKECQNLYISSLKKEAHSPKVKEHLDNLRKLGKIQVAKKDWMCCHCNTVFEIEAQLKTHLKDKHGYKDIIKTNTGFQCPYCLNEFKSKFSIMAHLGSCKEHPNKGFHSQQRRNTGIKMHEQFRSGLKIPVWKDRKHTPETKEKMRISTASYLQTTNPTPCRYNKSSIPILESIAKEHGWTIQHAENDGEFYTGIGYFVDAYDKEKNIVLEYDEPAHYDDVENNILREKDLVRQKNIIDHLHCEYWRFNEATQKLWKV